MWCGFFNGGSWTTCEECQRLHLHLPPHWRWFKPKSLTSSRHERPNHYDVGTGVREGHEGAESICCLSDWSSSMAQKKTSKFNRSKRKQEEVWPYHLAVCTVTWQKEICIPSLLLHIPACFYMEKSLDKIKKTQLSDPMSFVSTSCLIGW